MDTTQSTAPDRGSPPPLLFEGDTPESANFQKLCTYLSAMFAPATEITRLENKIDYALSSASEVDEKVNKHTNQIDELKAEIALLQTSLASLKKAHDKQACHSAAADCDEKIFSARCTLYLQDAYDLNQQYYDEGGKDHPPIPDRRLPVGMLTNIFQRELDRRARGEGHLTSPSITSLRIFKNDKKGDNGKLPLFIKFSDTNSASVAFDLINVPDPDPVSKDRYLYRIAQHARIQDKQYNAVQPFMMRLCWALKQTKVIYSFNVVPTVVDRDKDPHVIPKAWVSRNNTRLLLEVASPVSDEDAASLVKTAIKTQFKLDDKTVTAVTDLILEPRKPRQPFIKRAPAAKSNAAAAPVPAAMDTSMPPPALSITQTPATGLIKPNPWFNHPLTSARPDLGELTPGQRAKKMKAALKEKGERPRSQSRSSRASSASSKRAATSPPEIPDSDQSTSVGGGRVNNKKK